MGSGVHHRNAGPALRWRVILSVGMGALHDNWLAFERDQGRRTRAELLDEGLDVLFGLWEDNPSVMRASTIR